jgi:elongation factor G
MMIRKGRLFVVAIPEEMLDEVKEYRSFLLKRLLIMMKICWRNSEKTITEEEINKALRAAVMDMAIIPMIAGSSLKNKGVQFMLDAVCKICLLQ